MRVVVEKKLLSLSQPFDHVPLPLQQHQQVSTEHLLLGLICEETGSSGNKAGYLGFAPLTLEAVRAAAAEALGASGLGSSGGGSAAAASSGGSVSLFGFSFSFSIDSVSLERDYIGMCRVSRGEERVGQGPARRRCWREPAASAF